MSVHNQDRGAGRVIRTIRAEPEELDDLMVAMDGHDLRCTVDAKGHKRYPYRHPSLTVLTRQAGSQATAFAVCAKDLSATQLQFLHGGFLHTGTRCVAKLITIHGSWTEMGGRIISCQFLKSNIHAIAVEFDSPIDPAIYCPEAVQSRILLVEDDAAIARLTLFHMSEHNAQVEHATDGDEAVAMASKAPYDLILMDIGLPKMDGVAAMKKLRSQGYLGFIASFTSFSDEDGVAKSRELGFDAHLPKPYTRDQLARLLTSIREEPIRSSMHEDESMHQFIDAFIGTLPDAVRSLNDAISSLNRELLVELSVGLKERAGVHGFDPISEAAAALARLASHDNTPDEVKGAVNVLVNRCTLARGS